MFPHRFLSSDRQKEGPFPDPLRLPGARDCPGEQNPGQKECGRSQVRLWKHKTQILS